MIKNNRALKIISLIIVILISVSVIASCGNSSKESTTAADKQTTVTTETGKTGEGEEQKNLPDEIDYGGYDYVILATVNQFLFDESDGKSGDVIDEALHHRRNLMKTKYNVNVKVNTDSNASTSYLTAVSSNTYICDSVLVPATESMPLARDGYLTDLVNLNGLNLDASYYDQRIQSEYKINNMLFQIEGDYTINDEPRTMLFFITTGSMMIWDTTKNILRPTPW